jgi:outer membrane protein assembly factor BamA
VGWSRSISDQALRTARRPTTLAAAAACALLAARARAAGEVGGDPSDVVPPFPDKTAGEPLHVTVERTKRFSAGVGVRSSRGIYAGVAMGTFADEIAHGRAAVRFDGTAGAATDTLQDLRGASPVLDLRGRLTVREFPLEETTSVLTAMGSRQMQAGYTVERGGGAFGLGALPRSFLRLGAGYTLELSSLSGPGTPTRECASRTCLLSAFAQAISLDQTDPQDPERGYKLRLDLSEAGGPLGGDFPFVRASPVAVAFVPLSRRVTLAGRAQLGALLGGAPIYERFFAGGADSVRSYEGGRLSPYARAANGAVVPVGGRGLFLASLEVRVTLPPIPEVPIPFRAVLFADAGRVSVSAADLFAAPPSVAVGAGLRAATPVGLLRLDAGFSVYRSPLPTIGPGVTAPQMSPWAVHLGTGEAF